MANRSSASRGYQECFWWFLFSKKTSVFRFPFEHDAVYIAPDLLCFCMTVQSVSAVSSVRTTQQGRDANKHTDIVDAIGM